MARPDDPRKARRVDKVLAAVLLLSAACYAWRLLDGQVRTTLPGEGGLLRSGTARRVGRHRVEGQAEQMAGVVDGYSASP